MIRAAFEQRFPVPACLEYDSTHGLYEIRDWDNATYFDIKAYDRYNMQWEAWEESARLLKQGNADI